MANPNGRRAAIVRETCIWSLGGFGGILATLAWEFSIWYAAPSAFLFAVSLCCLISGRPSDPGIERDQVFDIWHPCWAPAVPIAYWIFLCVSLPATPLRPWGIGGAMALTLFWTFWIPWGGRFRARQGTWEQ